jgi:hypothetical protein
METKNTGLVLFGFIVLILGWTLYKQFDFEQGRFEKPALAVVYSITFLLSLFFLVRGLTKKS